MGNGSIRGEKKTRLQERQALPDFIKNEKSSAHRAELGESFNFNAIELGI
ncbi:MAG: hypothetical protein VXX31_17325 [Planctomycetota bacterium]|jgi:hypothetical protein|nr:hypothetical protein [Planctomycetota bacterium]MEC8864722.1 hypothetical protein [Planctomycetota bacterium]